MANIKDPQGNEVRVTEDQIASFEAVWAEQADKVAEAEEEGNES